MPGKKEDKSWDLKDIERLIDLLIERQITEFEMERGGVRVRIKRGDPAGANSAAPATAFSASWPPPPVPAAPAPPMPPPTESAAESLEGLHLIKSPIVGTFYASPAPNAPPFVKPGDVVEVGQVLCVIEAMKLMNDIESEVAGEVVRAYVENGQPVEYGQSLFAIKPSHKK
jgi:oxaloacetate decarboxylase (Na+ extruding) subunit alpha